MTVYLICSYTTFSIVYYCAGGTDAAGNAFIYDILDWSNPGPTVGYVFLCLVTVVILHAIVYGFYRYWHFSLHFGTVLSFHL